MAMHAWAQKSIIHEVLLQAGTDGITIAEIVHETGFDEKRVRSLVAQLGRELLSEPLRKRVPGPKGLPVCKYIGRPVALVADVHLRRCY